MIAEIGHFLLWLALGVSIVLGVVPLTGTFRNRVDWMALSRPLSLWLFLLTAASFAMLVMAFVQHDFSVLYVASNSNSELPLHYRITAVWGGHEGSMLLWLVMMTGWTVAVALFSRSLPLAEVARVLSVMGLLNIGFTLFTLATSNPFDRLIPAAADGRDLNPLLQDPGMIFHPPMLYMGYVGFSVAFAFAVSALISGRLDATWARWTRPWTTVAWIFLTLGIALGSWWAYYELGWGGWWFWDPVENASFMPWLVGTALIHSLAVTEKRGAFKSWTVLLAIMAFSLSLLGTFLVRSGVLSSVHAFATDPKRGLFILAFLVIVVGASLALFAWRAQKVGLGARFGLVSRETFLLANNVLLVVAMAAVMLGTLYPLIIDALGMGKLSVGPPYFNTVFIPLMAPLVFLIGVGPMARWRETTLPDLAVRLKWAALVALLASLGAGWMAGRIGFGSSLALAGAFWIVASTLTDVWEHVRVPGAGLSWQRARQQPRAVVGMWLAHSGMAVFIFGVTIVSVWQVERDVTVSPGQTVQVQDLSFTFRGVAEREGPNFDALRGTVEVARNGRTFTTLTPEKRVYRVQKNPMTEAAIRSRVSGDLYVSLGEPTTDKLDGPWILRIYLKPFVGWIWGGCVLMALGGLLAASDRRYRAAKNAERGAAVGAAA